ncbi:PDZ domain-containing protein [Sulfuracidifex metallicus]|uniref:M61 family metallopeptidase n=1 Tax=Sulfuracidifex metallicus TaxID=47303 RepID=UPI0022751450|nr:PDZ domain-containing protein [Sulfuracidifex metallicus]MCY0850505.1 PDZ domain-containing protein [Sulfuracidifex metallicus]
MYFKVKPSHRYIKVEAEGVEGNVTFPVWLPGSYILRELERNVVQIEGYRISKNKFNVRDKFTYKVYAMSNDQREAISTSDYLFINGPAVFPFQLLEEEYCVEFSLPEGWKLHTTLKERAGAYCADSYHELADSSFQASPYLKEYEIDEEHSISTIDELSEDLIERVRKVVKDENEIINSVNHSITSRKYLFYFRFSTSPKGGIEHRDSSSIVASWNADLNSLTTLFAHEYFHRLNVKYLKPKDLELNYEKESYTTLLWFAEGVTDYVAYKSSWTSKAIPLSEFLRRIASAIYPITFKGGEMSLSESSLTTWIKYYRRDENFPNSAISYYDGGFLMGLLIDLSLFKAGSRIEDKFKEIPKDYTFQDLEEVFAEYDVNLTLVNRPSREIIEALREFINVELTDKGKPFLGLIMNGDTIAFVEDGSPADLCGLCPNDKVISVNGKPSDLITNMDSREKSLTISREGRLKELKLKVGQSPGHKVKISHNDVSKAWAGNDFSFEFDSRVI